MKSILFFSLVILLITLPSITSTSSPDVTIPKPSSPSATTTSTITNENNASNVEPKYDETIESRPRDVTTWDGIPRPYAVLMTYGSCLIRRQHPNVVQWMNTEAAYFHNLDIKFVGDAPRIKFYKTKEARDAATVDSSLLSIEEMMALLKEPTKATEIPFTLRINDEWKPSQISALIEKYGVPRGFPTKEVPEIPE